MSEAHEETESSFCGFLKRKFRCFGGINTRRKNSSIDAVDKAALRYSNSVNVAACAYQRQNQLFSMQLSKLDYAALSTATLSKIIFTFK